MKWIVLLVVLAAAFAAAVNAQPGTTCELIPGSCAERAARRAYAPVDRLLGAIGPGGYYDYGLYPYSYGGYYGNGRGAIAGAVAGAATGALTGWLTSRAVSRRDEREYVRTPDGGRAYYAPNYPSAPQGREVRFADPKPAKPLDCRKPRGKRGRNEAACAAAEREVEARQAVADRQACLDQLAQSDRRLRNGSARWAIHPTVDGGPMVVCGEPVVLRPRQTIRIFPLGEGHRVGGYFFATRGAEEVRLEAKVRNMNEAGFIGFVLTAPGAPEGGN
jgi:hypothetical protein